MLNKVMIFILTLAAFAAAAPMVHADGFSADMVSTTPQGSFQGKICVDNDKIRMEFPLGITISRMDKKMAYMLMPEQKMYMEQPFDSKSFQSTKEKLEGEIERKLVGTDTVDGKPTKKYLVTFESEKVKGSVYQWMMEGMNFPAKTAAVDGSWTMEYKNIKIGAQPAELFEIPAGYTKMSYGNMAQMAGAFTGKAAQGTDKGE